MALSWTVRRVLTHSDPDSLQAQPGVVALSDGSYLFGWCYDFNNPASRWFRSTDQGETWTERTGTVGGAHAQPTRATNRPTGEVFFLGTTEGSENVSIMKSSDGAATWSQSEVYQNPPGPPFNQVLGTGIILVDRGTLIACGQFDTSTGSPGIPFAVSTDGGGTWTTQENFLATSRASYATAITNAGNGLLFCAAILKPAYSYYPNIFRSTDGGASWHEAGALPVPPNTIHVEIHAITAVTDQIIICCGSGVQTPHSTATHVFRSTDAGDTWSIIAPADIAGWNALGTDGQCREVKRITRDAVILGINNLPDTNAPPWALSLDAGATYPLTPSVLGASIPNQAFALGSIVVAKNGNILLPVYADLGSSCERELWIGNIVC